jgi:hypothetical protein
MFRHQNAGQNHEVFLTNESCENVAKQKIENFGNNNGKSKLLKEEIMVVL